MIWALAAGLIFAATPLFGGEVISVNYADLAGKLPGLIDFEGFATLPEPGQIAPGTLRFPGMAIGAHLAGQSVKTNGTVETLTGTPTAPTNVTMGEKTASLAVAFHAGFGSNAAFPIGPDGFSQRSGRGEGALALAFDNDIAAFAFRLHADYADPLGARPLPGPVTLTFYNSAGTSVARYVINPTHGVNEIGVLVTPPFRALTITHADPGGIAIDDIRYSLEHSGS